MGTEIATIADQEMASLMPLLMKWESEADLSDEQFHAIARFAASPPPALPLASPDELREMIAFLAGSLKAPRTGLEAGKIKLGAYRIALADQPKAALTHAVQMAIRTMEWLPAPAELLKLAKEHTAPEIALHAKACALARNRRQRQFEETLDRLKKRELSHDDLQALPDHIATVARTQGSILIRMDGSRQYRTKETIMADLKERMGERALLSPPDERDKRASKAPDGAKSSGSVGDIAAGLMAGMEVSDGD